MGKTICLNCEEKLTGKYCQNCGQEAETERFKLKDIFSADFLLGSVDLESGFFLTIKKLFVRPGDSVREYVEGKRVNLLHYFNLLVILITVELLLSEYSTIGMSEVMGTAQVGGLNKFEQFTLDYPRLYTLIVIPVFALISFLWFKKAKQNYAEHLVLNAYRASADMVLGLIFTVIAIFINDVGVLRQVYPLLSFLILGYEIIFYYRYFKPFGYSKVGLIVRSAAAAITLIVVTLCITIAVSYLLN